MSALMSAAVATLVFCAPGYPGGAGDAQPYVDQFAKATASSSGWSGHPCGRVRSHRARRLAKLNDKDSVLAFVPYAFFVQHGAALHLARWRSRCGRCRHRGALDAGGKAGGSVTDAKSLSGYTILSVAGYAPEFVKHSALAAWTLPSDVKIEATGQILSALRRVASVNRWWRCSIKTQAASLATLPFAAQLKSLVQSPPLPVALIAVVDSRVPAARAKTVQTALIQIERKRLAAPIPWHRCG